MAFLAPLFGGGLFAGTALAGLASLGGFGTLALRLGASLLLSAASRALMPGPSIACPHRDSPRGGCPAGYGLWPRPQGRCHCLYQRGRAKAAISASGRRAGGAPGRGDWCVYFDGEAAVDASGMALGRWAGLVTVEKRLGTDDQTAFEGLIAALPEAWTTAHRLRGCAAIHLRLQADQDAFPGGIPAISVDIEGKNDIFDPRSDTLWLFRKPGPVPCRLHGACPLWAWGCDRGQ